MYISRLVIKNFRNLQAIDVNLEGGLTCLVGENNSGKTNLLTALRLVLDANFPNYYRTLTKDDFSKGTDVNTPQQILIGVEITDFYNEEQEEKTKELALVQEWQVDQNLARVCYRFRPNSATRQAIESGEVEGTGLSIEDYEYELVGGAVNDNEGNLKDLNKIEWDDDFKISVKIGRLSSFRVVFLPAIRDVEEDLRRSATSPLKKLLDTIEIPEHKKEELVEIVKKANKELEKQNEIKELATDINFSMKNSVGTTFMMDVGLGMASPTFATIARALRILLSGHGLEEADPSRNGLGLNNVLYISMLMAYFEKNMQLASTAGQLLLIEEPEAHLHPQLQRALFGRLLSKECQIIATSHSTHISSRAQLDNLLILTPEDTGLVTACKPSHTPSIENDIGDLERYLDATKSVLLFARRVILVEGMSEVFFIPCLVKQVMNIDLEEHGVSFIPVYGVHFDSYLKLFVDKGIRKKCAVITDGDLKPSDASETDEDIFPRIDELKEKHESELVKIVNCKTTFERAIALPGNLKVFSKTAEELGASTVSKQLNDFYERRENLKEDEKDQAASKVLNTARRFGKARFAQIASKYVESANELPSYIKEAIEWIIE